ncbi:MAG TPA: Cys-tRNA(Pro) deacylase [Gaiellaceae bacterium]
MPATLATALLDREQVPYRLHEYEHDPKHPSYGLEAVEKLGLDPARVFKTLVADVDGALVCCVVPVEQQLDLRSLGKRARMARPAEAERATGYVVGGISPLGQRRRLQTIVDASALEHETVHVSAGRRGLEIELDPRDLVRLTSARVAACASA